MIDTHLSPDDLCVYDAADLAEATAVLAIVCAAYQAPRPVWPEHTLHTRAYQPYGLVLAAN